VQPLSSSAGFASSHAPHDLLPVSIDDLLQAESRIAPWVHRTPVHTCASINSLVGNPALCDTGPWDRSLIA